MIILKIMLKIFYRKQCHLKTLRLGEMFKARQFLSHDHTPLTNDPHEHQTPNPESFLMLGINPDVRS